MAVEVARGKPVALREVLELPHAQHIEGALLEFDVIQPAPFAAANVVEAAPEFLRHGIFTGVGQQATGVFHGAELDAGVQRLMEHDRIHQRGEIRNGDEGLAQ